MNPIVEGKNLSRFYGLILGLNNVNFTIGPGLTGVVGSNGAGKTTLFRLMTGQIRPCSGSVRIFGLDPWNNPAVQARVAYCPEGEAVPSGIGASDWITGLARLSGWPAGAARDRARAVLEEVGLGETHWKKPLTALSKGMRQRVKLAQCLVHDPGLIILDEPMNGLDPMGRDELSEILRTLARQGRSVLISSHILDDLEALCGEFLLLHKGRILESRSADTDPEQNRWPDATSIRCDSPEALARYFFQEGLLRGCDVEGDTLHARWSQPEKFHRHFYRFLLESGVGISEVRKTGSVLDQALENK
jgi:ABC-2 type transport system ATP-binding protein